MTAHRLDASAPHPYWDRNLAPSVRVESGDTVVFETIEGTGQVHPGSPHQKLANLDSALIHPLTGPVYVAGAEPGDSLQVDVVSFEHHGWGWNGVIPGFGLLGDEFDDPYIHHYELAGDECIFRDDIRVPFEPFCGVMGVAPEERGRLTTWPPRQNGGNVDIRHLTAGTTVRLPVFVEGALFSCGDCHAAQGDGEVNGTGIETPMTVTLRLSVIKTPTRELEFTTPAGRELTIAGREGYFVTTAHGPDLFSNAQTAVRYMLDHLRTERRLTHEEAYCLAGAAVDLKISEIVDEPNWLVSAYLPLAIFK